MQQESGLFVDLPEEEGPKAGFYDFKLLKTTAYSRLYVALKQGRRVLIKTTKDNSEWQLRLLRREYELSKNCDHPHLVHIYDFDPELPMGAALIMEYIEGRTLDAYLAERPTSRDRKRLFGELLSAVDYLHQRGIIHNDLKPENILITRANNTLKVIDFGLADSDAEYALRTLGCTPQSGHGRTPRAALCRCGVVASCLDARAASAAPTLDRVCDRVVACVVGVGKRLKKALGALPARAMRSI